MKKAASLRSRLKPPLVPEGAEVPADTLPALAAAGLRYVSDATPGIRRLATPGGFTYKRPDGKPLRDERELARIRRIAVPPAYTDVWICPLPDGHVQATARDARGRKQYRYHPDWRATRDEAKFGRMLEFGKALPGLRARVARDLARNDLSRERVLATVVRLLELTLARVGNEEYAKTNGSYGLTTLRTRHVRVSGAELHFHFRGKSGIVHKLSVSDPRIAAVVRKCHDLPGQELFQYVTQSGETRPIDSADVNEYLREAAGGDFTAKDFRTWYASSLALDLLKVHGAMPQRAARQIAVTALAQVARQLGNTVAICRKCYVHPGLLERFQAGSLAAALKNWDKVPRRGLSEAEVHLMAFLRCVTREAKAAARVTLTDKLRQSLHLGRRSSPRSGSRQPAAAQASGR